MDVLTVNPGMLRKTVDFDKFKSEEDKDFFASLFLVAGAIGNEISCRNLGVLGEKSCKIIEVIKKQDNFIKLSDRLYEESIKLNFKRKLYVNFKGVIDKVMYKDQVYALIVEIKYGAEEN